LIVRLRGLAETVPGVLYQLHLGADGRFTFAYVSEAVKDYFHLTATELSRDGALWFAQIHPLDREAVSASLLVSSHHLQPWQQEFRSHHSEGNERWLYGNAIAQSDGHGGVLWHGFLTDISRQRRDAQELVRHRLHLEELVEARTAELALT
ncbi:PAS domain-containing protein, partial [Roseateles sp. GG27B]